MLFNNTHYRSIWLKEDNDKVVQIIDQRFLPHQFIIEDLNTTNQIIAAIKEMHLRGAGLIGVAAGYGMYIASLEAAATNSFNEYIDKVSRQLKATRPTAVNLQWAIDKQMSAIACGKTSEEKVNNAKNTAIKIAEEDIKFCKAIGTHGFKIIETISRQKRGGVVNILTHCNAGWLAFVDFGTATSPIYEAHSRNIKVHVWVDETRPRNQGANLTAWELINQGVPHTVITDNAGGHLMQNNMVDIVITGADRVTCTGDVANKIGTYLKALAASDNNIPFYVAMPSSTIDWSIREGLNEIPIEQRDADEVKYVRGWYNGELKKVLITPENSPAANYAFDVTPAKLITGFITERGICEANEKGLNELFPEK
jgi:methylthioribose-1-phosphate isomerase